MLKYLWNVNNVVCIANTHMVSQHYTCLFYMLYMYTVFLRLTLCRCVHSEVVCTQLVAAEVTCLGVKQTFSGQHSSMCWKSSSTPHHPSKGSHVLQSQEILLHHTVLYTRADIIDYQNFTSFQKEKFCRIIFLFGYFFSLVIDVILGHFWDALVH